MLDGEWEQLLHKYNKIEAEYLSWSQRARFSSKQHEGTSGNLSQRKLWDAPAGNSYLAHQLADAGGYYLWEQYLPPQIEKLNFAQEQQLAKNAVVWITLTTWKSKQELQAVDANYFHLNAFR